MKTLIFNKGIALFFRITNRLFVIFITILSKIWGKSKSLDSNNTNGRSLLVVRHGGFGDLLFLSPALNGLKLRHPQLKIDLMTHPRHHPAFQGHPAINQLIDHRWPSALHLLKHEYIIFLDGAIETDPDSKTENIYDLITEKYFKLTLPDTEKKPSLCLNQGHRQNLKEILPGFEKPAFKIAIQLKANSPVRTPDLHVWTRIIKTLGKCIPGCLIYIIAESQYSTDAEQLRSIAESTPGIALACNTSAHTKDVTALIALVSLMDAVIVPDSSVAHIAAAFDIPTLGVYGPFPADLRIRYYQYAIPLDAPAPCAPCFTHGHWPCKEARKSKNINSPCFHNLSDNAIFDGIQKLLILASRTSAKKSSYSLYRYCVASAKSETSKFRPTIISSAELFSEGPLETLSGVEIGSGGDPLLPESVCVDLELPYTRCGTAPIHFKGDGKHLPWFADESLDYLYSSHLFEDFDKSCNKEVMMEWIRVLKPNGLLLLLLPHQQRYLTACLKKGELPNEHHQIDEFGPDYLSKLAKDFEALNILKIIEFWTENPDEYNFLFIAKKNQLNTLG